MACRYFAIKKPPLWQGTSVSGYSPDWQSFGAQAARLNRFFLQEFELGHEEVVI